MEAVLGRRSAANARIPEIEIADHADPPRIGRQYHEGNAWNAVKRHRMGAELVVDALMGTFTEKIQVEVGQHGRKAVGVIEIDHGIAEAGAQLVAPGAVRQRAGEQPGVMNARQRSCLAMLADRLDVRGFGQERAHNGPVVLGMRAEIMKRIGVAAFDNRIGLGGQFGHTASLGCRDRIRSAPVSGTRSQSGRWASSYSIS